MRIAPAGPGAPPLAGPRPAGQALALSTWLTGSPRKRANSKKVAGSDEAVLKFLRSLDFTNREGERVIELAKSEEGGACTLWQLVQGGTALARAIPHADERVTLERRVSRLLKAA